MDSCCSSRSRCPASGPLYVLFLCLEASSPRSSYGWLSFYWVLWSNIISSVAFPDHPPTPALYPLPSLFLLSLTTICNYLIYYHYYFVSIKSILQEGRGVCPACSVLYSHDLEQCETLQVLNIQWLTEWMEVRWLRCYFYALNFLSATCISWEISN